MAMETAVAIEPKIKKAMKNIGLGERADDLLDMLDEIELDRRLAKSLKQFKRGETLTLEELDKRVMEKFKNGYYLK